MVDCNLLRAQNHVAPVSRVPRATLVRMLHGYVLHISYAEGRERCHNAIRHIYHELPH